MSKKSDIAIDYVIQREGGSKISEDARDAGGTTKFGISLRFLKSLDDVKKYNIHDEIINSDTIKQLTSEQSKSIYFNEFYQKIPLEQLTSQELINCILDAVVNTGISPAVKCLQRAIWAATNDRKSVVCDGILGKNTLSYCNKYSELLVYILKSERAGYYRLISEKSADQKEAFLEGWLNRAYEV